jgi:hypothetical protein
VLASVLEYEPCLQNLRIMVGDIDLTAVFLSMIYLFLELSSFVPIIYLQLIGGASKTQTNIWDRRE